MTSSLVGSEMCIRDSQVAVEGGIISYYGSKSFYTATCSNAAHGQCVLTCLLYTSDAADDM
eukprot:10640340-Prorocentrum_lima.AAC.1